MEIVLTVYSIATLSTLWWFLQYKLQQHLPFTVLKLSLSVLRSVIFTRWLQQRLPFTVLKQEIEIFARSHVSRLQQRLPFTVLKRSCKCCCNNNVFRLQQYLPFTVLKRSKLELTCILIPHKLEQRLPFMILKHFRIFSKEIFFQVATAPTVYGMRRRVWGSRGAKWRWGPHNASTRTKWR